MNLSMSQGEGNGRGRGGKGEKGGREKRKPRGSHVVFYDQIPEVTQHHSCHFFFSSVSFTFKEGKTDSASSFGTVKFLKSM